MITEKGTVSLKNIGSRINYISVRTINGITTEQMRNLLQDYYEGELKKRNLFIRGDEYRAMSDEQKKKWVNERVKGHKQGLMNVYERPRERPVSEVWIRWLWKMRKRAEGYSKKTHGSLIEIKRDFYRGIREIFDQPMYERTGKHPWDDKPLPVIPIQQLIPEPEVINKPDNIITKEMLMTPTGDMSWLYRE